MSEVYGVIYLLFNKVEHKCYVGQTRDYSERMRQYTNNYSVDQPKIHEAIELYGWDNFSTGIIDIAFDKIELKDLERYYIALYGTFGDGYNGNKGGGGTDSHSPESCAQMTASQKARYANDPLLRDKQRDNNFRRYERPGEIEKASESMLKYFAQPGSKEAHAEAHNTPEAIATKSNAMIEYLSDLDNLAKHVDARRHLMHPSVCEVDPNNVILGKHFDSAASIVKEFGFSKSNVSRHLRGKIKHINGYVFRALPKIIK